MGAAAGLHLIAWLPGDADAQAIQSQALDRGIAIDALAGRCWTHAPCRPALLFGYGAASPETLRRQCSSWPTCPPTAPPTVEYELTELGRELLPAVEAIADVGHRLKQRRSTNGSS